MASYILRSIYREAASCNWAARSGNWVCRKANFVGSSMRDRSPMSTVSDGISSSSSAAPLLMLPPSYDYGGSMFNKLFKVSGKMDYKFYSLADDKVVSVSKRSSIGEEDKLKLRSERAAVLVGSSHGWLALHRAWCNWDLFLYNPISHRHIKLPSVKTIPLAEEKLRDCWGRPTKVILSCSPDEEHGDLCRAILCFDPRSNMALCYPGRSTEWTPFGAHFHENEKINELQRDTRIVRAYEDFVYSTTQKQLFCVTQFADFESWDLGDPTSSPTLNWKKWESDFKYDKENYPWAARSKQEYELKGVLCGSYKYLVFAEHSNQLFLVRRHVTKHRMGPNGPYVEPTPWRCSLDHSLYKTVGFDVHLIDREKEELRYMDGTLDGMSFFIGSAGHGFLLEKDKTVNNNNVEPDSIYFTDPMELTPVPWIKTKTHGGHDIGIFHYGNRTISPCYYPCDIHKVKRIAPAPMWFTPSPSPV